MKNLYLFAAGLLLSASMFAQAPQKMNYQTVILNSSQALVRSATVGMKISVLRGSSAGTPVYVETQTTLTNANGLASIVIGDGSLVSGSFTGIDWTNGSYFVKTEIDTLGGASYTVEGNIQLLSVPYAMYANNGISTGQTDAIIDQATSSVTLQAQMDAFQKPKILTTQISQIGIASAVSGGSITYNGLGNISARGVVWGTSPSPSIALYTKTNNVTEKISFVSTLSGLTGRTTYYVRAYATSSFGTAYGNEISFTTIP